MNRTLVIGVCSDILHQAGEHLEFYDLTARLVHSFATNIFGHIAVNRNRYLEHCNLIFLITPLKPCKHQ